MNQNLFNKAIETFDQVNSLDPNFVEIEGEKKPHEFVYAIWLSEWITKLNPNAGEELRLAARCQHLKRWEIPRSTYPEGLKGYNKWKKDLAVFHSEEAGKILKEVGYDDPVIERVKSINLKKNLKTDPEVQTMEDALCLVTLQHQIEGFSLKHDDEKIAKAEALKLHYSERVLGLIKKAIS